MNIRKDNQDAARPCRLTVLLLAFRASVLLVIVLASSSGALAQECPEPAVRDGAPLAEPLRVVRRGTRRVDLSWDPVNTNSYRIRRGNLGTLWSVRGYTHFTVEEDAESPHRLVVPNDTGNKDFYFLVTATCVDSSSSAGRDSGGRERPTGGMLEVNVELVTADEPVSGVGSRITFPKETLFTSPDLLSALGPFAEPGVNPLIGWGLPPPGDTLVVIEALGASDPLFDAPALLYRVPFGYMDSPPAAEVLRITECTPSDVDGNTISGGTCRVVDFTVLY